jgi:hypothetical protein
MVNIPMVGAPAAITANCRPAEQGQMPPSLVEHHRQPSEPLLYAGTRLGLLLCRDANFFLLIGIGFCVLRMR